MNYYLLKLGRQELGSITTKSSTPSRGRYLYISKAIDILSHFPPLTVTQKNDTAVLPIVPIFDNRYLVPEKIYCNFVYHNDKYFNGSRNEYRIYSNNRLEDNQIYFEAEDIVVIRKDIITENTAQDKEDGCYAEQIIYYMDCYKPGTTTLYGELLEIIDSSPIRGFHGIYSGHIQLFEEKVSHIRNLNSGFKSEIDDRVTAMVTDKPKREVEDLFNSVMFRDFVLTGYDYKCAITRTSISYENFYNLEAAHIIPRSHGGSNIPANGISLSRDMHWAFDKGLFTITTDLTLKVHPKVESEYLSKFDNSEILLPSDRFFVPSNDSLEYHQDTIYGLFLTSGRL